MDAILKASLPKLREKLLEALQAVLPIAAIVLVLCFTIAPVSPSILLCFLLGAAMIVVGIMFFTLGAEMSMTPMGERVGAVITKSRNTVSENGSVARGVCVTEPDGTLHSVTERTRIETYENGVHFTEDGGASWTDLPGDTPVSMNLWGFGKSFLDEAEQRFAGWLTENLPKNPLKCEYFLPLVVTELIEEGKAKIQVLRSTDKWYGVTYREDKPLVVEAIARKTAEGQYPENLWA